MASDLEPIDIDINMRQNVSEESDKAVEGIVNLSESTAEAMAAMEKDIDRYKAVIEDMRKIIDNLHKQMEQTPEMFGDKTVENIENTRQAIDEAQQKVDAYADSMEGLNKAAAEGADVVDLIAEANTALSDTEATLIEHAKELIDTQGAVNTLLDENTDVANTNSASNKVMSVTIDGICRALGIENTLVRRSIANTKMVTAVKMAWAKAVAVLNTQLGISIGLSKAFVATGIGAIVAAVGLLILAYQKWSDKQQAIADEMEEAIEKADKFNNTVAEAAGKPIASYRKLQKEWNALSGNLKAREKYIIDNKKEFEALGVQVEGVADAENILVNNTQSVITALKLRAQATAYQELAAENYKKAVKTQLEADKFITDESSRQISQLQIPGQDNPVTVAIDLDFNIDEAERKQKEISNNIIQSTKDGFDKATEEANKEADNIMDIYIDLQKKAREELEKAGITPFTKDDKGGSTKNSTKDARQLEQANKELLKKTVDYQNRIDAARIAAMQEGAEKERAATRAEHDKTKHLIEQELAELAELEKITDKPATEQRTRLIEMDVATTAEYEAKMRQINETSEKEIDAIFADAGQRFRSELDNNLLQINQYYDKLVLEARKAGADIDKINELNTLRDKELEQERIDSKIQSLEFDTQIALRRMAISGKFYLFESDKIKESLQTQKQAAQQRLKLLQEQYKKSKTKELERDIEAATVQIEEMDAAIRNLDLSKFQELAGYVNQIASGLSSLAGDNSSAGKFMEWMGGLADGAGQIAAGISTGNPAAVIDGAFKAVNTIKDIFSTSSRVRKEIRQFYQELEASATQFAISVINTIKDITGSADSIFSTDITNNLTKGMEGYNAAVQKEKDLVQQLGDTTVQVGKKKKKFLGITTGSKTVWESILTGYKKVLDTDEELVDASGQLNREMAEALLNSGKLSTEAEALINNILSAQDAATAAMQQVESTLSNIAGSIGDDLRNALVEAFKNGDVTTAADSFGQSASKILEDWITQTMFSSVFGDMLSELEGKMKDSFGGNGDQDITDDIAWFMQNYQSGVDEYMKGLEKWKQQLKDLYGIEVFGDGEREGTSAGLERISQDSANELNGNFYALRQQVGDIRNLHKEANVMRKAMQAQLDRIAENTEYCRYLLDVKNSLDDMQSRGIKIKA